MHHTTGSDRADPAGDDPAGHDLAGDDLTEALLRASRALVGVAARSLADVEGVTLAQYRALVLVAGRERTTVSDLAAALGIHSTSASRLCDRLVAKRFLRRSEGTTDRRQTDLHLTAAARRLLERVARRRRKDLAAIVEAMGVDDAAGAIRVLDSFSTASDLTFGAADALGWEAIET